MNNLHYPLESFDLKYKRKSKMIDGVELGLCRTCNYIYSCTLRKRFQHPVWQCEEFDDSDLHKEELMDNRKIQNVRINESVNSREELQNHSLGLCSDCKNRKFCTYPVPASGISCCEEYE